MQRSAQDRLGMMIEILEKERSFSERDAGFFDIEEVSAQFVLGQYKKTLENIKPRTVIEPPSALWIDGSRPVELTWETTAAEIGFRVKTVARGMIRKEFIDYAREFVKLGAPYFSTGAVYCTIPNKSYARIELLSKNEQFLFPVLNLGFKEEWIRFWGKAIDTRRMHTEEMLGLKKAMPDIFSVGNPSAGTGAIIRGLKRTRAMLDQLDAGELEFLKNHQEGSALCFAATAAVRAKPGKKWLIRYLNPSITLAKASRSDPELDSVTFEDNIMTSVVVSQTRQVGGEGSGALSNSDGEKRAFGRSCLETIWRDALLNADAIEQQPPFLGMKGLFEMWATPTTGKEGEFIVIGEDFGMSEPIKAGADQLFSGTFIKLGSDVMPHMLSGTWYTSLAYVPFHLHFGQKIRKIGGQMVCLGDDMNIRVKAEYREVVNDILKPYVKIKSTRPKDKKILGFWAHEYSATDMLVGQTPRIQKSVSSASAIESEWKSIIPEAGPSGSVKIKTPEPIERAVLEGLPIVKGLTHFRGDPKTLVSEMDNQWRGGVHTELLPEWIRYYKPESQIGEEL